MPGLVILHWILVYFVFSEPKKILVTGQKVDHQCPVFGLEHCICDRMLKHPWLIAQKRQIFYFFQIFWFFFFGLVRLQISLCIVLATSWVWTWNLRLRFPIMTKFTISHHDKVSQAFWLKCCIFQIKYHNTVVLKLFLWRYVIWRATKTRHTSINLLVHHKPFIL